MQERGGLHQLEATRQPGEIQHVDRLALLVADHITGMGAVTPAGVGIEPLQQALERPRAYTRL